MQFTDKKEIHQFQVYNTYSGFVAGTYTFTKIKTLDGIKGTFLSPLILTPPLGYDDILTSNDVGQCKTATIRYNSPSVKYKDASGVEFGVLSMSSYEWIVPKGWKVFNNISDGITPIISNIFADITPDPLTSGEFKIRATNICNPNNLIRSTWFKVALDRPAINLKVISDKSSINCGDQTPINFSIENASLISCINSYSWNIGTGWLLSNGSIAPAIYTTNNTNLLTLIPSCGKILGSVSATIAVNNVNYLSSANMISIIPPSPSIIGNNTIGNTENYSIQGLTCEASVMWTVEPANIVNLSCTNCNQTTLTRIKDGDFKLTAIVKACGIAKSLSKVLTACAPPLGKPTNLSANVYWPNSSYYGYNILFMPVTTPTNYYLMDFFDITTNKINRDYTIPYSGFPFYHFLSGHIYKYRLAAVSTCGSIGDYSDWSTNLVPPVPSFTLPSKINISCGSITPQTFVVTNQINSPGNTSYAWDLGSASNGWFYNSTAAAQIIYTATNSLTLIPSCSSVLSNIKATVTLNNVLYTTNTSNIIIIPSVFNINGNNIIMNSENYNIENLPCSASILWSVFPTSLVNLNCTNCLQPKLTTLVKGNVTLTAVINACNSVQSINKIINTFDPPSKCALNITSYKAYKTHSGGSYHDGFETCTFELVPDAISYQIESQAFNLSTGQTQSLITSNSSSNTKVVYTGSSLPNVGWSFRFRVRANCRIGGWGNFSNWSSTFSLQY